MCRSPLLLDAVIGSSLGYGRRRPVWLKPKLERPSLVAHSQEEELGAPLVEVDRVICAEAHLHPRSMMCCVEDSEDRVCHQPDAPSPCSKSCNLCYVPSGLNRCSGCCKYHSCFVMPEFCYQINCEEAILNGVAASSGLYNVTGHCFHAILLASLSIRDNGEILGMISNLILAMELYLLSNAIRVSCNLKMSMLLQVVLFMRKGIPAPNPHCSAPLHVATRGLCWTDFDGYRLIAMLKAVWRFCIVPLTKLWKPPPTKRSSPPAISWPV